MRLVIVNRVSEAAVQDISLAGRAAPHLAGNPAGLAVDDTSSSVFVFTSEAPWELKYSNVAMCEQLMSCRAFISFLTD